MNAEEIKQIRQACVEHAEELLVAADDLLAKHPHLAYHLCTLALEEIGKAIQYQLTVFPSRDRKPPSSDIDDHVHKLFWALLGPITSRDTLTSNYMESCRKLSKSIHQTRLKGLYVDYSSTTLSIPKHAVSSEDATTLHSLANERLTIAKFERVPNLSDEDKSLIEWFFTAIEDDINSKFVFGKSSLDRLAESKDTALWIRWIKEQLDKSEQEAREILKKEIERQEPQGEERLKPKWEFKIRLLTPSHSIRQSELNWINSLNGPWTLKRGKDQTELFVTITLPSIIPVQSLWFVSLPMSR